MSTMTREELLGVLNGDHTLDEIEAAIKEGELSQEEWGRICDFLRTNDKQRADELFNEILQDIDSIPAYDDGKAAVKGWKEYRSEVAYEIKAIKLQEIDCVESIEKLKDSISQQVAKIADTSLTQQERDDAYKAMTEMVTELDSMRKHQSDLFKRHAALDLMAVEAKDFVKQAEKRVWLEQTEPIRKGMGFVFAGIKLRTDHAIETVQEMGRNLIDGIKLRHEQNQNTKELVRDSDNLSFHPIEKAKNSQDIFNAKIDWKVANHYKEQSAHAAEKLLKEQNEIMKKAQKLVEKQARPTFMEKLEAWSKGEKVEPKPVEKVADYERAKEILEQAEKLSGKTINRLKGYEDTIRDANANAQKFEEKAMAHMERVAERMRERQEEVLEMQQQFEQMLENGELNQNVNQLNEIQQNLDDAYTMQFVDAASFDQDMLDMMRENGMDDVIMERE